MEKLEIELISKLQTSQVNNNNFYIQINYIIIK